MDYAQKYSPYVDEAFTLASLTEGHLVREFDWTGVNTVNIYTIPTVALTNYTMSGTSRFGTLAELNATAVPMTLTQDKSFTFSVDKRNNMDTMGADNAEAALARQLKEVIIPTVDAYRLSKLTANASATHTVATTKANAYEEFLKATEAQDEAKVPQGGRVAWVTPAFYNKIKQDIAFSGSADGKLAMGRSGYVGDIDNVAIIKAPSSYMPADTSFVLSHASVMPSPVKLAMYRILDEVMGIDGKVCEGRIYYDAFVLPKKDTAIVWHKEK